MRHATSRYHEPKSDKLGETYQSKRDRMANNDRYIYKIKKHKRHKSSRDEQNYKSKKNYEEVVEIHDSSSDDEVRRHHSEYKSRKHKRHCSEHRKRHKSRHDDEEPISYSEDDEEPTIVKQEPESDMEQRVDTSKKKRDRRNNSDGEREAIEREIKQEREEEERRRDVEDAGSRFKSEGSNDNKRTSGKRSRFAPQPKEESKWGNQSSATAATSSKSDPDPNSKQKPNFEVSGKLAEDTNMFNGVLIKYSEPPEARKPKRRWRLYPFKGEESLPPLYIHRQSAYLLGRDRKVADIPIDHPSCSKQHAALQYRLVTFKRGNGTVGKQIKLYIIDLESANGTYINNKQIESKKYVELIERDVIKFGFSSREYVLLHEHSTDDDDDDDDVGGSNDLQPQSDQPPPV